MSGRRKRAPPVRVDEEAKKKLDWNMLEDRRIDTIQENDDQTPTGSGLLVDSFLSTDGDVTEAASVTTLQFAGEPPSTSSDCASASASLALTVVPVSKLSHIWKALIGEFSVRPAWLPSDYEQRAFTLHRMGEQLCVSYSSCDENPVTEEDTCTAECSLSRIPLEDIDWLQKRRVVHLCHQEKEESVKV